MKRVCFINGSLRGKKAASLEFIKDVDRRLSGAEFEKTFLTVAARLKESYSEEVFESITSADAIVFVFPLHNYGLPGALMRLLEDYYRCIKTGREYNKGAGVYGIINCAYPRPGDVTGEAVRVMKNLCRRLSLNWRFAVCIGTGPVVVMTKDIPFLYPGLKKAYAAIASDIRRGGTDERDDYLIRPIIPEPVIAMIKRHYEKKGRMIERDYRQRA